MVLKITNSIDHIAKSITQMGPNFIPPESVKRVVLVGQKLHKMGPKKREAQINPLGFTGTKNISKFI